jgi:glycosyltransferase involved in cell wall biosynthesis
MCGWAIQTYLVAAELRRGGQICEVLKINENRRVKSSAYIDVQGGWDYFAKLVRFTLRGYRVNVHVNGSSRKGYLLALIATVVCRFAFRPALLTFHGGLPQDYFPRHDSLFLYLAFRLLFQSAGKIACDSMEIQQEITKYGIKPEKVSSIATFSPQYLTFTRVPLGEHVDTFLSSHQPVIFSYVSFRPEYRLEVLRDGMKLLRQKYPEAGFIWLGFPDGELPAANAYVDSWTEEERRSLLLLGNLKHDEFLTLLTRCSTYLRSPACDGVAASVLESLALNIPVVAS